MALKTCQNENLSVFGALIGITLALLGCAMLPLLFIVLEDIIYIL
jgi:hypothetical protein